MGVPLATYRQVTEAHLVALAQARGGAPATLDRGITQLLDPSERGSVTLIGGM